MQSKLDHAVVPAGPADAVALARVHVQSWRETYPGILPQAYLDRMAVPLHARRWGMRLTDFDEVTLVAEGPEGLVGYCSGQPTRFGRQIEGEAEVTTLYLLKMAQGQGLGRQLMTATVRALAARGATSLAVGVLRDNAPARAFYERLGGACASARSEMIAGVAIPAVVYRWFDLENWSRPAPRPR